MRVYFSCAMPQQILQHSLSCSHLLFQIKLFFSFLENFRISEISMRIVKFGFISRSSMGMYRITELCSDDKLNKK